MTNIDFMQAIDTMPADEARLLCKRLLGQARRHLDAIDAYRAGDERRMLWSERERHACVIRDAELCLREMLELVKGDGE